MVIVSLGSSPVKILLITGKGAVLDDHVRRAGVLVPNSRAVSAQAVGDLRARESQPVYGQACNRENNAFLVRQSLGRLQHYWLAGVIWVDLDRHRSRYIGKIVRICPGHDLDIKMVPRSGIGVSARNRSADRLILTAGPD